MKSTKYTGRYFFTYNTGKLARLCFIDDILKQVFVYLNHLMSLFSPPQTKPALDSDLFWSLVVFQSVFLQPLLSLWTQICDSVLLSTCPGCFLFIISWSPFQKDVPMWSETPGLQVKWKPQHSLSAPWRSWVNLFHWVRGFSSVGCGARIRAAAPLSAPPCPLTDSNPVSASMAASFLLPEGTY